MANEGELTADRARQMVAEAEAEQVKLADKYASSCLCMILNESGIAKRTLVNPFSETFNLTDYGPAPRMFHKTVDAVKEIIEGKGFVWNSAPCDPGDYPEGHCGPPVTISWGKTPLLEVNKEASCRNCRWLKSIVRPQQGCNDDAVNLRKHTIHTCRHPAHHTVLGVDWFEHTPAKIGVCNDHGRSWS